MFVDDDVASVGGIDTDFFQTEVLGVGMTANSPQKNVSLDCVTIFCVNGQISRLTLDSFNLGPTTDLNAGVFHPGSEDVLDVRIKSTEDGVTADEEVGLGSEGVEDTSEFYSDVTSTDDDDPFWLVLEFKETVRGDAEVGPGNFRGDCRVTTDGDANVFGFDGVGILTWGGDLDLGGGVDGGMTVEKVNALPLPVIEVDTAKFLNVSVALKLECRPVEIWFADVFKLVPCGLTEFVGKICSVPHQLFWDAS